MPASSQETNIYYSHEPERRYEPTFSENLESKSSAVAPLILTKKNCKVHIFFLYILLTVSTVITVSAVYICNGSRTKTHSGRPTSGTVDYKNVTFDCSQSRHPVESWYFMSQYNPGYACEPFKTVSSVYVQPLQVRGHGCNDTEHCYDLIRTYLGIMEGHSKFGYFIDDDANVYGGRGWFCQFWASQIWVAVMVEGFGAASQTEKDRILHNFIVGIILNEKQCSLNLSDLQFNYFDAIVI